jgi:hypothetical protein
MEPTHPESNPTWDEFHTGRMMVGGSKVPWADVVDDPARMAKRQKLRNSNAGDTCVLRPIESLLTSAINAYLKG